MNIGWIIFGFAVVVVLLTSVFKTINLSTKTKALIALILSVAAGAVTVWVSQGGDFSSSNIVEAVGLVYAASQVIYNFILKGTFLDQTLTAFSVAGKGSSDTPTTGA